MNSIKTCLLLLTGLSIGNFETRALLAATPTVSQKVGRSITLECNLRNPGNHNISWSKSLSKNDESYLNILNGTEIQDDRYALVKDTHGRSISTLEIKNLQATDAGFYRCSVTYPDSGNFYFYETELLIRQ